MTDTFQLHPQIAPSVVGSALKAAPPDSTNIQTDEPEDYTIKCICGYEEDDGNTVYCETCDTWQHTECYYIDEHGAVPTNEDLKKYDHFCADCQPRPLDKRGAIERQRDRRKELEPGDRKVKKPTSKSHKKKIRVPEPPGSLTNGWAHGNDADFLDRTSRSPRDPHPPTKRTKTHHRFPSSMNIPSLPPNPTSHPHNRSGSTIHSPSKTHPKYGPNDLARDVYSIEFLHLYDNDPGDASMQTNLLSDIDITRDLGNWSNDVDELEKATNGLSPRDVFNRCEQPVASMALPQLNKEHKDEGAVIHGRHPRWKYLTIDSFRPKDSVVAELKGKIGHMQRYIQDPTNRWDYLRHPAPFVFFHPKLPIYIDTRSEGTTCRYLRRSCDPNLSMKTFLENGSEYHFCFVAKQDLDAGSELTIGWVLDEHIRNYFSSRNHDDVKLEGDLDEDYVADWVGKVLAEFGGCACNSPDKCALAKYDRRNTSPVKGKHGYSGKQSPLDTGYATNSRAGSEQDDGRSSSGSKSQSRDLTPTHNVTGDMGFGAGLEISDREKRKIAALEKNFEQLENDKHQPAQKKKKRNSGGSTVNTPSAGTSVSVYTGVLISSHTDQQEQKQLGHPPTSFSQPNTPGLPLKPHYADASTSRRKSGSPTTKPSNPVGRPRNNTVNNAKKRPSHPNTPLVPSPLTPRNYVDSSMQTEPEREDAWYTPPPVPTVARRPYMSLTKRLLLRSQQDRAKLEERRKVASERSDGVKSNGVIGTSTGSSVRAPEDTDVEMPDAGSTHSSPRTKLMEDMNTSTTHPSADRATTSEIKPPPPWPTHEQSRPTNGYRSNDLRVQLPTKLSLTSNSASNTPLVETPTSAISQSPFSHNPTTTAPPFSHPSSSLVQPSPIKKKVSLGEYFSRRKGSQPATEMQTSSSPTMQQGILKTPALLTNGALKEAEVQGSAVVDTPKGEEGNPLEQRRDSKS